MIMIFIYHCIIKRLKIGLYRELGIDAVTDENGNISKCHICILFISLNYILLFFILIL